MMKAAPPFSPTRYGNLQRFPRPTAEPAIATRAPKRLPKLSLAIKDYFAWRVMRCFSTSYEFTPPLFRAPINDYFIIYQRLTGHGNKSQIQKCNLFPDQSRVPTSPRHAIHPDRGPERRCQHPLGRYGHGL